MDSAPDTEATAVTEPAVKKTATATKTATILLKGEEYGAMTMDQYGRVRICLDVSDNDTCIMGQGGEGAWDVAKRYFRTFGFQVKEQ